MHQNRKGRTISSWRVSGGDSVLSPIYDKRVFLRDLGNEGTFSPSINEKKEKGGNLWCRLVSFVPFMDLNRRYNQWAVVRRQSDATFVTDGGMTMWVASRRKIAGGIHRDNRASRCICVSRGIEDWQLLELVREWWCYDGRVNNGKRRRGKVGRDAGVVGIAVTWIFTDDRSERCWFGGLTSGAYRLDVPYDKCPIGDVGLSGWYVGTKV